MKNLAPFLLVTLIACDILLAYNTDPEEKKRLDAKKAKMYNFMRDLHNANSINDLSQYGIYKKPAQLKAGVPSVRVASILGRSDYKSQLLSREEDTIKATPGKCDPKPVCISNPLTENIGSTQYAFPPCINIHRCDGCCMANENCVAIGQHQVKLSSVGIITFDIDEGTSSMDETSVMVTNHTDCQCQCKWKTDADCQVDNPYLVRNPHACECICPEELYCDAFHQFDRESCTCKCRQDIYRRLEDNCDARGFYWQDDTCRCETSRRSTQQRYSQSVRVIRRD